YFHNSATVKLSNVLLALAMWFKILPSGTPDALGQNRVVHGRRLSTIRNPVFLDAKGRCELRRSLFAKNPCFSTWLSETNVAAPSAARHRRRDTPGPRGSAIPGSADETEACLPAKDSISRFLKSSHSMALEKYSGIPFAHSNWKPRRLSPSTLRQ